MNDSKKYFRSVRLKSCLLALALTTASPHTFADLQISGIDGEALKNLQNLLSLNQLECDAKEWKVKQLYRRIPDELKKAVRPYGYYHASVKSKLEFGEKCWEAELDVTAGEPVILKEATVRIEGEASNDDEIKKVVRDKRPFINEPLQHAQYKALKSGIQSTALDRGYFDGQYVQSEIKVDIDSNEAFITLLFDSGARYHFDEIRIEQDALDPEFVSNIIGLDEGKPYTSARLVKIRSALNNSGYFSSISVEPQLNSNPQHKIPVTIKLIPNEKHHFSFGVGFDTDIGPILTGGYTNRRVTRTGHSWASNMQLSPVKSFINSQYIIPLSSPLSDKLSVGVSFTHEDTDSYKSDKLTQTTSMTQTLDDGWSRVIYADLTQESYQADNEREETLFFIPGVRWAQTVVDNVLRPTDGHHFSFEVKASKEGLISDLSFAQVKTSATVIQLLPGGGTFIGRTDLGATAVSDFDELPTSQRFFAGGLNSIRGYDYKELGPTDSDGDVVGGRFLGVFSAEYEHPIFENWGVATFVDTGNAFDEDRISIKTGVGMGVRWYSPIGPVRLDLGIPLNESDSGYQIHFATGPRW